MINVLIGVVLFSKKPSDSDTLNSLLKNDFYALGIEPCLYIRDNSLNGFDFQELKEQFRGEVVIVHDGKNDKLSRIYNKMIEQIEADYFILLDDDSYLEADYFENLKLSIGQGVNIAIPKIFHSNALISPGAISGVKGKEIKLNEIAMGFNPSKNLVAMMSGTIVNSVVFEKITFDERLSFYGVDTKFFLDYQNHFKTLFVMNCSLRHDSALRNTQEPLMIRFQRIYNLASSWVVVYEHRPFFRIRLTLRLMLFTLKNIFIMKSILPIKLLNLIIPFWKNDNKK